MDALANLVTIVGLPLIFLQLFLSDRTRAAQEIVELHAILADRITQFLNAQGDQRAPQFYVLMNAFESMASLLNRGLVSIWAQKKWRAYLAATIEGYALHNDCRPLIEAKPSRDFDSVGRFLVKNKHLLTRADEVLLVFGER